MKKLMVFNNSIFGEIRTLMVDDKPYFVGKDIAEKLGYVRPNDAILQHCRGTAKHRIIDSIGRNQEMSIIPEGDLYRLIIKSKLPEAEQFEAWVMDEVIPQIRQTGGYIPISQDETEEDFLARALIVATNTLKKKDELLKQRDMKILEDKPKVESYEKFIDKSKTYSITEGAKLLGLKPRVELTPYLKKVQLLTKFNKPTITAIAKGLMESKDTEFKTQARLTTKGIEYVRKNFKER